MPIVPLRSGQGFSPGPLPRVRIPSGAPIEAFGGGVAAPRGPDLSGALGVADHIAAEQQRIRLEEKAKADQIAVTDAGAQLSAYKTHALYNEKDGALNQTGKNAFGLPETVRGNWDATVNVIRNGLANDDQKAVFDRMAINQWEVTNEELQHHVAAQRAKYDAETTAAFVTNKRQEALQSFDDPGAVESSIAYQRAALMDQAKRNGLPDEVRDEHIAHATSATRTGVIEQLLNTDQDLTAAKYFADHREDFVGQDLLRVQQQVDAGSLRGASQRQADAIFRTSPTFGDALKATQAIDDPKLRDAVETRLRQHFNDAAADQRHRSDQARVQLGQLLEQNGGNIDRLKTRPEWLFDLDDNDRSALERRAKIIRHPDEGPGDEEAYLTLLNQAYFNPGEFSSVVIPGVKGLNVQQKTRLMTLQRTIGGREQRAETQSLLKAVTDAERAIKSGDRAPTDTTDTEALSNDPALQAALAGHPPKTPTPARKLSPPTPQMLQDIARKGPRYAAYLRTMGVDAPDEVPVEPATPKSKAKKP